MSEPSRAARRLGGRGAAARMALGALFGLSGCTHDAQLVILLVVVGFSLGLAGTVVAVTYVLVRACRRSGTPLVRAACVIWGAALLSGLAYAVLDFKDMTLDHREGDFWWSFSIVSLTLGCAGPSWIVAAWGRRRGAPAAATRPAGEAQRGEGR